MIALLDKLTEKHKIELSVIKTGHDQFTSGGSVSNHFVGRGIDIARVDGEIVNSGSPAARELATEIAEITGEIGRPRSARRGRSAPRASSPTARTRTTCTWPSTASRPPGFTPPAPAAAAAAAVTPGQPAAAAAAVPAEPKPKPGDSGSFMAVKAEDAAAADPPKKGDSGVFMAVKPAGPASALAAPGTVPAAVADAATATASGSSSLGASALEVAKGELAKGVREEGVNTGADVDKYLAEAGVAPGNPWCASFVTWALAQSGHKMEGGGWAGVQTWVRAAEAGTNDLQIVSAEQARPGDIVTYDWGGQEDFGADGHIGFLASDVEGGKFTALEGNNQDAVMTVPRQTSDANVKFLRIGGDAPPPAAAPPAAGAVPYTAPAGGGAADVAAAATDAAAVSDQYPGDDAPKEQIAAWMAKQAEDRGLPPQLPVMASLVESGLKNLNFGDADSVGFYQMRVGIWNQGEYAGYPDKPELQVKWFLDQAEAVKEARVAAGKPIDDPNSFGEWIADVERPAEQYRGRYQLQLDEANSLLGQAASAPPAAPAAAAAAVDPAAAEAKAAAARDAAEARRGDSGQFMSVKAEDAKEGKPNRHASVQFMKAIDPKEAKAAAGPAAAAAAVESATPPAAVRRFGRLDEPGRRRAGPRQRAGARGRRADRRLPGRQGVAGGARQVARDGGEEGGAAARATGDGRARGVGRQEPQGRRRRLRRLLPDARRDLGHRRVRLPGLPAGPPPAGQVVHRQRARGQAQRDRGGQHPASARTPARGATGSPTSSDPRRSTAGATSSGSTRRAGCCASPRRRLHHRRRRLRHRHRHRHRRRHWAGESGRASGRGACRSGSAARPSSWAPASGCGVGVELEPGLGVGVFFGLAFFFFFGGSFSPGTGPPCSSVEATGTAASSSGFVPAAALAFALPLIAAAGGLADPERDGERRDHRDCR